MSLVRSYIPTPESSTFHRGIGFLNVPNRVTVALSRQRQGLFILGNKELLMNQSDYWKNILEQMDKNDMVCPSIVVQCPRHGNKVPIHYSDVNKLDRIVEDMYRSPARNICKSTCGAMLACGHGVCQKKCHMHYPDSHSVCKSLVGFKYPICGHPGVKECNKNVIEYRCMQVEEHMHTCRHVSAVKCYELLPINKSLFKCQYPCERELACGHPCREKCHEPCTVNCQECVEYKKEEQRIKMALKEEEREHKRNELKNRQKKALENRLEDRFQVENIAAEDPNFQSIVRLLLSRHDNQEGRIVINLDKAYRCYSGSCNKDNTEWKMSNIDTLEENLFLVVDSHELAQKLLLPGEMNNHFQRLIDSGKVTQKRANLSFFFFGYSI